MCTFAQSKLNKLVEQVDGWGQILNMQRIFRTPHAYFNDKLCHAPTNEDS